MEELKGMLRRVPSLVSTTTTFVLFMKWKLNTSPESNGIENSIKCTNWNKFNNYHNIIHSLKLDLYSDQSYLLLSL